MSFAEFFGAVFPAIEDTTPVWYGPIDDSGNSGLPGALRGTYSAPSPNDVRDGVPVGSETGNLVLPGQPEVKQGEQYGSNGTQYTGTLDVYSQANLPSINDVRDQVIFGNSQTGILVLPLQPQVLSPVEYGANSEFVGSLVPSTGTGYRVECSHLTLYVDEVITVTLPTSQDFSGLTGLVAYFDTYNGDEVASSPITNIGIDYIEIPIPAPVTECPRELRYSVRNGTEVLVEGICTVKPAASGNL